MNLPTRVLVSLMLGVMAALAVAVTVELVRPEAAHITVTEAGVQVVRMDFGHVEG